MSTFPDPEALTQDIPSISQADEKNSNPKQKKPYDYKIDGLDNNGEKINKIYSKLPAFVVYRTENAIRIDIDDDHKDCESLKQKHMAIGVDLGRIYSWLPEKLGDSEPINKQIARAMTTNVIGNHDDAKTLLKHAEERIIKKKTITGRLQYTSSAFFLVFILAFVVSAFTYWLGSGKVDVLYYIALCGSLGGLLSISIGFSTLEIDIDATQITNYLIGCSRILIAITAAIFSYFAIKSEIAFTFIGRSPENYGLYMIAMISGFIEMLIPNIMSNLAKNDSTTTPQRQ
jgi:hypothetical protein